MRVAELTGVAPDFDAAGPVIQPHYEEGDASDGGGRGAQPVLAAALLWRTAGSPVEYEDGSGKRRTAHIRHVRD